MSEVAESSAWGAAMNGLLGIGICTSLDELTALPREVKSFRPQMKAAEVKQISRRLACGCEEGSVNGCLCETSVMLQFLLWLILPCSRLIFQ